MPLVSGYRQHVKLGVSQIVERLGSTDDEKQGYFILPEGPMCQNTPAKRISAKRPCAALAHTVSDSMTLRIV
ncbi:hypothetical protein AA0116_g11841 [Alternaria tenuissima]|nr:hypothetical protein AA0116_g11841 [Alternaria tenuissima]